MTGNGLPVEIIELRRNGMRLRPEEWPEPMVGCLRMHYWDGKRNSSRRTLRQLTLYGSWGTTVRPVSTLTDPQLIDVLEILISGMASASTLAITGSSTASGRRLRTRAVRSRTSAAALSASFSSRKRTLIWLWFRFN